MMEGWEVTVGDKPKSVSWGTLEDFNKVFTAMFKYFSEGHEAVKTIWMEQCEAETLNVFSNLEIGQVRNWLKYYQLVTVEKIVEPLGKPIRLYDDKLKTTRTEYIIKPTARGFYAYENCQVITVDVGTVQYKVGIGKNMTYWDEVYGLAEAIWKKHQIAISRREKWYSELKEKYLKDCLDKYRVEATRIIGEWAADKAFQWNKAHKKGWRRKARIKNPVMNEATGEILLDIGQGMLENF